MSVPWRCTSTKEVAKRQQKQHGQFSKLIKRFSKPPVSLSLSRLAAAILRFRGFSKSAVCPAMKFSKYHDSLSSSFYFLLIGASSNKIGEALKCPRGEAPLVSVPAGTPGTPLRLEISCSWAPVKPPRDKH